jgi:hypothetical protein
MGREMTLLEEMVMAAGVERLFRKRRRNIPFGMNRRLAFLALVGAGVAISFGSSWFQEHRSNSRQHSAEYPELAA